jgi:Tol biopolymer transport system component/DNA-binding winged helix-turn-helix (wHTH) protein
MPRSDKPSYEFGPFRLDAAEYVLLRDGRVIPLSPKLFETLLVLVENSGHVVDKNELYKQVWQDVVVEETNLTKNISILRKILSDGDEQRSFIETVPKRGYRFVVPVRKSGSEDRENGATSTASLDKNRAVLPFALSKPHVVPTPSREIAASLPEFQRFAETDEAAGYSSLKLASTPTKIDLARPRSSAENTFSRIKTHKYALAVLSGIAALLITGVGFGLYKFALAKRTGISLAPTHMTRLTSSGTVYKAAISADGKWLVHVEYDGENQSLWLKQVAVPGSQTQIAPTAAIYQGVAISPDGNYVYYTLLQRDVWEGVLYQVPILGGEARRVLTHIHGPVALSPDGKKIAFYRPVDDEDRLMVANADGTGERQLVARRGNECLVYGTHGPSWSPDSKTILTPMGKFTPERFMTVAAVSAETGAINLFTQQKFQKITDVAWLPNGQGVLVTANDQFIGDASVKIWQISYPSGDAQRITNDLNSYTTISLTADSNALATVKTERMGNLWIGSLDDLAHISQITTGTNLANFPKWADGRVVYALSSGYNTDLFLLDPREGTSKQLTANSGNNDFPAVSPDGRYIVFSSDRSGVLALWRIDIDGSNPKQLTNQIGTQANFSPDGRTIAYMSSDNKNTISTIGIDGGEPRQLTNNTSGHPVFSPDGTKIVCLYEQDSKVGIAIIPANGGSPLKTFPLPSGISLTFRWTPDGKAIMYSLRRRGVGNLWVQPIEGGEPKQLTNFTSDLIHSYDVSPDGKQFVFSRGINRSDVVLFSGIRQ